MFVITLEEACKLTHLPQHEELQANGKLIEWREGMGDVAFISQTWLSNDHPDNAQGDKCALLVGFLKRVVNGTAKVTCQWQAEAMYGRKATLISTNTLRKKLRFVWFDVMSVPQADAAKQQLAIASIASYVHSSSYFICLAGPWTHATNGSPRDVRAWLTRGWCRTEVTANALSPNQKSVIVVQSPSDVVCHGPGGLMGRNWISALVGQGTFSVDADREPVGGALSGLVDARVARARKAGSVEEVIIARALTATKAHLLQGLGEHAEKVPQPSNLDEFLAQLGFNSVTDGADTGWTPLRLAVMAGRRDLVKELLDLGVDVESAAKFTLQVVGTAVGMTVLHMAAIIRDDPEMIRLLLSRGANPRLRAGKANIHALHYACTYGRVANLDALMDHDPELAKLPTETPIAAILPFHVGISLGQLSLLRHVLQKYPDEMLTDSVGPGMAVSSCTGCVNGIGDVECLRLLLDAGFKPDTYGPQVHGKAIFKIADMVTRLKTHPKALFVYLSLSNRCGALHAAALNGNVECLKELIKRGCNVTSSVHSHGATPLHLAAYNDHQSIVSILLEHGADPNALDNRKRTPAQWARRQGYPELANKLEQAAKHAVNAK